MSLCSNKVVAVDGYSTHILNGKSNDIKRKKKVEVCFPYISLLVVADFSFGVIGRRLVCRIGHGENNLIFPF